MEPLAAKRIGTWLDTLPREMREELFVLLDELCAGMDVSRHNEFGFLRSPGGIRNVGQALRLHDRRAARRYPRDRRRSVGSPAITAPSALEDLRTEVESHGHPDYR
ncbi:MAG: hypothetical protein M3P16_00140 [Chloroflexota bacterium]|nr:hypothetical protein [Chloroflexota bacterium]